jgi:hypothetical protein
MCKIAQTVRLQVLNLAPGRHHKGPPMPFSKHQIDPAHIEAMRAAFSKVCEALLLKCDTDAR